MLSHPFPSGRLLINDARYVSIATIDRLYFSGCAGCTTSCCNGSRFAFLPLILDDFAEVYHHFPIVFAQLDGQWRALILLSGENGQCRYYHNGVCHLYDNRPPGCRLYPITPFYDDVLVDLSCPAVTPQGTTLLASTDTIDTSFYHHRLDHFESKRRRTFDYIAQLEGSFSPIGEEKGVIYCRYDGARNDPFIQMHFDSLSRIENLPT